MGTKRRRQYNTQCPKKRKKKREQKSTLTYTVHETPGFVFSRASACFPSLCPVKIMETGYEAYRTHQIFTHGLGYTPETSVPI